jgi:hypothetical protein
MGKGTLELTLAMDLLGEHSTAGYSGTLARMQASHFNRFFSCPAKTSASRAGWSKKQYLPSTSGTAWLPAT